MVKFQPFRPRSIGALLLLTIIGCSSSRPEPAQTTGCQPDVSGQSGAQVTAQVLQAGADGALAPAGEIAPEVQVRSGQVLRLHIRPVEGSARPSGPGCPVRASVGGLSSVARLPSTDAFVFDRNVAYGQFRPGEERTLDFQVKPFEEWGNVREQTTVENATISFPETTEFVARLPAPYQPPAGTVCADVVYPDAQPAPGVVLGLTAPPDGRTNRRPTGPDGRACWDGFDVNLFGDLSLRDTSTTPALGQPTSRYVSFEASYRLFVVKRPA